MLPLLIVTRGAYLAQPRHSTPKTAHDQSAAYERQLHATRARRRA
jgi:hypothetical protein